MRESTPPGSIIKYAEKEIGHGLYVKYILTEGTADSRYAYSLHAICGDGEEAASLHDITSLRDTAERIFKMICDGTVTPCCLAEAAEDLIETILEDSSPQEKHPR